MGTPHEPDDAPQPYNPVGKAQCLAMWRKRKRIPILTLEGMIVDLIIVSIRETAEVDGLPLDCLLETQAASDAPVKSFGVIFCETPPDWLAYKMPVLWLRESAYSLGRWRADPLS